MMRALPLLCIVLLGCAASRESEGVRDPALVGLWLTEEESWMFVPDNFPQRVHGFRLNPDGSTQALGFELATGKPALIAATATSKRFLWAGDGAVGFIETARGLEKYPMRMEGGYRLNGDTLALDLEIDHRPAKALYRRVRPEDIIATPVYIELEAVFDGQPMLHDSAGVWPTATVYYLKEGDSVNVNLRIDGHCADTTLEFGAKIRGFRGHGVYPIGKERGDSYLGLEADAPGDGPMRGSLRIADPDGSSLHIDRLDLSSRRCAGSFDLLFNGTWRGETVQRRLRGRFDLPLQIMQGSNILEIRVGGQRTPPPRF